MVSPSNASGMALESIESIVDRVNIVKDGIVGAFWYS